MIEIVLIGIVGFICLVIGMHNSVANLRYSIIGMLLLLVCSNIFHIKNTNELEERLGEVEFESDLNFVARRDLGELQTEVEIMRVKALMKEWKEE